MVRTEMITMSMREIDRLKTVQAVVEGNGEADSRGGSVRFDDSPGAATG